MATEVTVNITVDADVSPESTVHWVFTQLNMPGVADRRMGSDLAEFKEEELDTLDALDGDVEVQLIECLGAVGGDVYAKAVELWGRESQALMLAEECGELLAAVSQFARGRVPAEKVTEEAADVHIMLAQVPYILGGDPKEWKEAISYFVESKRSRLEVLVSQVSMGGKL